MAGADDSHGDCGVFAALRLARAAVRCVLSIGSRTASGFFRQLSRQHPAFYLRHRTGDLIARATNDVDRVVFAAGEGVLTLVDSLVMGLAVLIVMATQISWELTLHPRPDAGHGDYH